MELVILGVVAALNMLIIKLKLEKRRYEDAALDVLLMITLSYLFLGSYSGMVVAMIASLFVSISLFISPPSFTKDIAAKAEDLFKDLDLDIDPGKKKKTQSKEDEFKL